MNIVIHCGGMKFHGNTIKEKSLGGSETAAYYMALNLANKGHMVVVFSNIEEAEAGEYDGVKYAPIGNITNDAPMGSKFTFYAENTPHDVLIIQRHPRAFERKYASKINLLWLHDLMLHATKHYFHSMLWNIDGILCVSEHHKKQIIDVAGFNPDYVFPIQNGIDLNLFAGTIDVKLPDDKFKMLYSSRPERGLEHLVREGGIMERLAEIDKKFHLYVCAYDNVSEQMAPYYAWLKERCDLLPNVTILGSLTKKQLADVMRSCDLMTYTTEFEEVSCITAMECMAAGLPLLSSAFGALPETCKNTGSILLPLKDGVANTQTFLNEIVRISSNHALLSGLAAKQRNMSSKFDWSVAAEQVELVIDSIFAQYNNSASKVKSLIYNSDFYAAQKIAQEHLNDNGIMDACFDEMLQCYTFTETPGAWSAHYNAYYEYEKNRGVNYGPEDLRNNSRFEYISDLVGRLPAGSDVLDYGCAHGHYTVNLAKRHQHINFTGVDIASSNIEKAESWAESEGLSNIKFICGHVSDGVIKTKSSEGEGVSVDGDFFRADCVIVAEVLEHVAKPQEIIDSLSSYVNDGGWFITTTPFGSWEAMGYEQHWPWRAHVHHFERDDLKEMFGHHNNYKLTVVPNGRAPTGEAIGSFVCQFQKPTEPSRNIDYGRKIAQYAPRQTVSLCMIVKDAESDILRCLKSAKDVVSEIIIGVDRDTTDNTLKVIQQFKDSLHVWPVVTVVPINSPVEIGFDKARNIVIQKACGDWILWMDADEILHNPQNIHKYLRNNQFHAYAIRQQHFSIDPAGLLKTDLPTRLFRNHRGVKFFGVVHEHPETELNEGIGYVQLLGDVDIAHYGYSDETVRRKRFWRNIELLVRDREQNPNRTLGKFLWVRDLAQMCVYELEQNGGRITPEMKERSVRGAELWKELVDAGEFRMAVDCLEYYSSLIKILGVGFDFGFKIKANKLGSVNMNESKDVVGHFLNREHIDKLVNGLIQQHTKDYGSRYF